MSDTSLSYWITYLSTDIFCAILTAYAAGQSDSEIGDRCETFVFRLFCYNFLIDIISQSLWIIGVSHPALFSSRSLFFINLLDLVAIQTLCYIWMIFIVFKITPLEKRARITVKTRITWSIPYFTGVMLNLCSAFTGWTFRINEAGVYERGPLYCVHAIISFGYYFFSMYLLFKNARHRRLQFRSLIEDLIMCLLPILGGMFQIMISRAPFTSMAVTGAILFQYTSLQRQQINTDALTGLYNRKRLEEVLATKLEHARQQPFYIFLIDLNYFKNINDTYGHVNGDRALIHVARSLTSEGKRYENFFAARYGGDEFIFVLNAQEIQNMKNPSLEFENRLNKRLESAYRNGRLKFPLSISVGSCYVNQSRLRIDELIRRADRKMYQSKSREHHKQLTEV